MFNAVVSTFHVRTEYAVRKPAPVFQIGPGVLASIMPILLEPQTYERIMMGDHDHNC